MQNINKFIILLKNMALFQHQQSICTAIFLSLIIVELAYHGQPQGIEK